MPGDCAITEEMKQAEAAAWKTRLAEGRKAEAVPHEIRAGGRPKFVNDDSAAKLRAFDFSWAAEEVLDAAIKATEEQGRP